jgi:DNA (cytosine-5)-methyltransferase 1
MTAGFLNTGRFEVALAVESEARAARTYALNFGDDHLHEGPIQELQQFPPADVVVGGPPCQGFSPLNRQREATVSRGLWREYLRVLQSVLPGAFVMENVPELLTSHEYGVFRALAEELGYHVRGDVLNAADYGVPQRRRRAIVIGVMSVGNEPGGVPWPTETHGPNAATPWVTVREALEGVSQEPDGVGWHRPRKPRPESVIRYRAVPKDGGNRHQMQQTLDRDGLGHLVPRCWRQHSTGSHDVFGRLWWDRPAPTIRTEFYKPEKGRYLHPQANRSITIREGALLQTMGSFAFPENLSMTTVGRQIGNAVPPLLAERIADVLVDFLSDTPPPCEPLHASESLSLT